MAITIKQLKEEHGDNITFLFKGQEPFTPDQNGNPLGVLIERNGKIMCYECGKWFKSISSHLRSHNITAMEYKIKYGFNLSTGLCTKKISNEIRNRIISNGNRPPKLTLEQCSFAGKKHKKRFPSMQYKNSRPNGGTCPEQIKERIRLLIAMYGKGVTEAQARITDMGAVCWAYKYHGGWNKMRESIGLEKTKMHRRCEAELIYDIREYVKENNSLPYFRGKPINGFKHGVCSYVKKWGSMTKAYLHCGIQRCGLQPLNEKKQFNGYYYRLIK